MTQEQTVARFFGARVRDALEVLAFLAISVLSIWDGFRITATERREGMFDPLGPDRYLMLIGALLGLLGIARLLSLRLRWRVVQSPAASKASREAVTRFALLMLSFVAYVIFAWVWGYGLATVLFFASAYWIMGVRGGIALPFAAAISTAAFAVIFITLADLPLPKGMLGFRF